ncbi:MAG: dephospho-CoA kinase [Candidatus Eisenbacteria bacterium]|nr:dephospho-CoA kinase [Candidatus Eisenbacteria bacterium]
MFRVGLVGGIGTGKSEVARLLEARGAAVIRADDLARELVEPGTPTFRALVESFGETIVAPDGRLDRRGLGSIAFASEEALAKLNAITHPPLVEAIALRLEAVERERGRGVVVVEAALLAQWDVLDLFDLVVAVRAPLETRIERLARDGLSREDALARMRAQRDEEALVGSAGAVIDNDGTLARLESRVNDLWESVPPEERNAA